MKISKPIKAAIITIVINLLLVVIKLFTGIYGHSLSMVADAFHSLSDVLSTVIVVIALFVSAKKDDENHPYGHERFEPVATMVLSFIMLYAGIELIKNSFFSFSDNGDYEIPTMFPLFAAIISIMVKEAMFWYSYIIGKKSNSSSLKADAWHHRSDALTSVGALIGIIFAQQGFHYADIIASVFVSVFIVITAIAIFVSSLHGLTDESLPKEMENQIRDKIASFEEVKRIDILKTRQFASRIFVDVEISLDENMSLVEAHEIAEKIHDELENSFPSIKHCMVHVNPFFNNIY